MTSYELMNAIQSTPDAVLVVRDGDTFWHVQSAVGKPGYIILQQGGQFQPSQSMANSSTPRPSSSQPNRTVDNSVPQPGSGSTMLINSSANPDGSPSNGDEVPTEAPVEVTKVPESEVPRTNPLLNRTGEGGDPLNTSND